MTLVFYFTFYASRRCVWSLCRMWCQRKWRSRRSCGMFQLGSHRTPHFEHIERRGDELLTQLLSNKKCAYDQLDVDHMTSIVGWLVSNVDNNDGFLQKRGICEGLSLHLSYSNFWFQPRDHTLMFVTPAKFMFPFFQLLFSESFAWIDVCLFLCVNFVILFILSFSLLFTTEHHWN